MTDGSDDWRNRATCRGEDPELWFPNTYTDPYGEREREAMECCWGSCPVRRQCLRFGLYYSYGIYGGRLPEERKVLRNRLKAVAG